MPPGPDGDDEELVEIDLEPDGPPPLPLDQASELALDLVFEADDTQPNRVEPEPPVQIPEGIEVRQPIAEAAEADPIADLELFEAEAAATDGGRRAALLLEIARLQQAGQPQADLEACRAAFAGDPSMPLALWPLRRLLARAGLWTELVEVLDRAARARPAGADPAGRADLLVERGRLLEDRLDRAPEAIACYQDALAAISDHLGALLALLLIGARRQDPVLTATALGGLARRADAEPRRTALAIEESRAWRISPGPGGVERALTVLEGELGRLGRESPLGSLLVELDLLTREDFPADVTARALDQLVRQIAPADPALAVALLRERARVLLLQPAPEAALEALNEAARLDPTHPLVAAERIYLAVELDRLELAGEIARAFVAAAASNTEAVDLALAYAETAVRAGRVDAATEILRAPRVWSCRSAHVDLRAFELAIAIRQREAGALADALSAEAGSEMPTDERSKLSALVAAGAIRDSALGETKVAEDLYRRALAGGPTSASARLALRALVGLLTAGGRIGEAAELLEGALAVPTAGERPTGGRELFETWAREALVSFYADELGEPGRAVAHQRRLVALAPDDVNRRVRLCDLDLGSAAGDRLSPEERADNLMALGGSAGDSAVAVALRVEAGRTLAAAKDAGHRARGVALLRDLAGIDPSGLAASALERASPPGAARAEVVSAELTATAEDAAPDAVRALRFRLAHQYVAGGRYPEALAALTPLRSEGDPLARAWSYELARRSGEAILEVAVLSEETRALDGAISDEVGVLLANGEALARAGDPQAAAASFRQALVLAPVGETATDAALWLFRLAVTDAVAGARALPEALGALALATADDPAVAAAAAREESLARAATGEISPADLEARASPDAPAKERAEMTLLRFMAGARQGDARVVAEALAEIAFGLAGADGTLPAEAVALLGRAVARARLAGPEIAETLAVSAWQATRQTALAPALTDLPVKGGALWPAARPDLRRARARRTRGTIGSALDLEVGLDAERRGSLGAALAAYGSVIAVDPDRLEAWTGIRRVARAGGDLVGEARALVRLGALVSNPERAAALFVEAGGAYERSGRTDDAIAALGRAVELCPDDAAIYARVHALLRADLGAPGRALAFDGLLSYRLAAATLLPGERIALLFERAEHRLSERGDRVAAFNDFKQILNINPEHLASIYKLAYGAIADEAPRAAIHWLERYLALVGSDDAERAADALLDLGSSYEAAGEPDRALETFRRAAVRRPTDPKPVERMSEIYLGRGDVRNAVEALRNAEPRLPSAGAQAAIELRIGEILRDVGRDPAGAAAAFRRASDLEPMGTAVATLVALADAAGDARGALAVVEREVTDLRRALAANPLDPRRLERLATYLEIARVRGAPGAIPEAEAAVESVRQLIEGRLPPLPSSAASPGLMAPKSGRAFIAELADPAAGGFVAEVWPHLVDVAATIFPPPTARGRRTAIDAEPSLAWVMPTAAAIGFPRIPLYLTREAGAPGAAPIEDPDPGLVLAAGSLTTATTRFEVGRALGLLAQRATVLERASAGDLAPLFACAAILAGAAPPSGLPKPTEGLLREVTRAISRKNRKALTLQASRFGFEALDLGAWREAVLRAASRFGLLVVGDPALAAIAQAGGSTAVPGSPMALDLVRFALGDRYPALKRAAREVET
jgi:tetratricopeptide (TPR) repeat protein